MAALEGCALAYLLLLLTGIPFLVWIGYLLSALARGRNPRDTRWVPLAVNALLYPFAFALFFVVIAKVFGVDREAAAEIGKTLRLNEAAAGPSESHNPMLALLFLGGFYLLAVSVPTQLVSMGYAAVASFLIASGRAGKRQWAPYAAGVAAAVILIALAHSLRTPIFNWLRR
jgi:hypothetical protein